MLLALLELLATLLLEPLFWWYAGPRHEPPRADTRVLGDIGSPRGRR